jgi:hypothetical protein
MPLDAPSSQTRLPDQSSMRGFVSSLAEAQRHFAEPETELRIDERLSITCSSIRNIQSSKSTFHTRPSTGSART